jgi:hypothetical protein
MMNGYKKKLNLVGSRVIDKKKKKRAVEYCCSCDIVRSPGWY